MVAEGFSRVLTPEEIERAIAQVPERDLDDIKFAQAQVRKLDVVKGAFRNLRYGALDFLLV